VSPVRLFAWSRADARGAAALVGEIEVGAGGARLLSCRDPELASALAALSREDHLPLTIRQLVAGNRHVRCERLRPADADYWRALAEGLTRLTGHHVSDADQPPG
jgi:hypothetical protein